MQKTKLMGLALICGLVLVATLAGSIQAAGGPTPQEQLGKSLFFDTNLSTPPGEACAACHASQVGYTGPDARINEAGAVYEGAVPGRFGNRKPPTAAYAGDSPILNRSGTTWAGGMFWDGRATGWVLGDPLAEQAQGPFLNPLEQNNASAQVVIDKVKVSGYATLFAQVCTETTKYYECIGRAIAAYERSKEVNSFTSKYDYYLKGQAILTGQEKQGLDLFNGKANCANCHVAPLFTDFTYDNLGVPKNPDNPFYNEPVWNSAGANWVDEGLGGFLKNYGYGAAVYEPAMGKQKVPTLRNVDLRPTADFVKAYSHNGYFKSLEEIVHFYNTRDVSGAGWPAPEVAANVNHTELGNLSLNKDEELAIVAFLKTLSDGYKYSANVPVTYVVVPLYKQDKSVHGGAVAPIKLALQDKTGQNLSSPEVVVKAVTIRPVGATDGQLPESAGNANPGGLFRYLASQSYIFNLKTAGLTPGTWELGFTATDDPGTHFVQVTIN